MSEKPNEKLSSWRKCSNLSKADKAKRLIEQNGRGQSPFPFLADFEFSSNFRSSRSHIDQRDKIAQIN